MSTLPARRDRIVVVGVLNVTPDSFSDGGRYESLDDALAHAVEMRSLGADLIDVGGESTRPGAQRIDAAEESRRVVPVLENLSQLGIPTSIDTYRAQVADAALTAGASVVNDVSGGLGDPDMAAVVRSADCPWILMHWRGHSATMQQLAHYDDVVADVRSELIERVDAATAAGVDPARLVLDPGLGFAKTAAHNWALLAELDSLVALGHPVLVGSSRKSFLGKLLAAPDGAPRPVDEREDATTALTAYSALAGAWGVRVHDVRPSVDAAPAAASALATDRIELTGLRVRGHHGVFEHERRDGQDFVVDVALELDTRAAAASDDLAQTVDYGALATALAAVVGGEPVDLLETLAARLADVCLADPRVGAATVTVHKPQAPIELAFTDVAVTIRRAR
jgi:dihydropteroate synthase